MINKTFKQLNAERAARRAQYKKAIDEEDWFTIEKIQKASSHKPQASSFKRPERDTIKRYKKL